MVDWKYINEKYPSKLDESQMNKKDFTKARTLELYSYLPQTTPEERMEYTDIRDAVVELNYLFFGWIASNKFINNNYISYEDKFQSALYHFCTMWWKFQYSAKYRTDLSFGVFFSPRIGECMERELNEVKYSLRRTLCMKVGDQLIDPETGKGKHWAKVTYEDLADPRVKLSGDEMASLQAMFGSMYVADLDTHAMFIAAEPQETTEIKFYSDNYNSLTDMLIHEMVVNEKDLSDSDLLSLAMMLDVPFAKLKELMPTAKEKLYKELKDRINLKETFSD